MRLSATRWSSSPSANLADASGPNFSEDEVKALAAEWPYSITDISNETGRPFERQPELTDRIPGPYPNKIAAAAANGGDLPARLLADRESACGCSAASPNFVVDAFAGYAENGPDYLYALLLAYQEPPEDVEPVPAKWYNPRVHGRPVDLRCRPAAP